MWDRVYAILDRMEDSEELIMAEWYEDDGNFWYKDGRIQCVLGIQLRPGCLDYEELNVSL